MDLYSPGTEGGALSNRGFESHSLRSSWPGSPFSPASDACAARFHMTLTGMRKHARFAELDLVIEELEREDRSGGRKQAE